ncbi:MAG TPA: phosphatidylserine/phosphatidylglycerophosphate/cardiolipin synthase family protein [Verrucomicrobiae bacterium]
MSEPNFSKLEWLCTGHDIFPAMLEVINKAEKSIRLETYIYSDDKLGRQFFVALLAAARRGVRVSVLLDAMGSWLLPGDFFKPLVQAGGEMRLFNPLRIWRFGVRDHRKILLCDDRVAFIGGFNISDEYDGDGVTCGWCDLGVKIENPALLATLAATFDELFVLADFRRKPLLRLRAYKRRRKLQKKSAGELLLTHPGRGASPFQKALYHDLTKARDLRIIIAYFLPTRKLRRLLIHAARHGARVQLILAGKTDVLVSQLAARSFYHRLLKAGVEIYEYQPQILHAKLIIVDGITYVGSSNLDMRSLNLNYELMLRLDDADTAADARNVFQCVLKQSRRIELLEWQKSQTFWRRWEHRWAHFLLMHIDPYIALRQFHAIKNCAVKI